MGSVPDLPALSPIPHMLREIHAHLTERLLEETRRCCGDRFKGLKVSNPLLAA